MPISAGLSFHKSIGGVISLTCKGVFINGGTPNMDGFCWKIPSKWMITRATPILANLYNLLFGQNCVLGLSSNATRIFPQIC